MKNLDKKYYGSVRAFVVYETLDIFDIVNMLTRHNQHSLQLEDMNNGRQYNAWFVRTGETEITGHLFALDDHFSNDNELTITQLLAKRDGDMMEILLIGEYTTVFRHCLPFTDWKAALDEAGE